MFFDNWQDIFNIFISCLISYIVLVILLRISGKRTLSKWNAFDFVVTIALGSILASVVLSKKTAVVEGLFAAFLLIVFQFIITFFSSRFKFVDSLIKAEPTLLYYKGDYKKEAMKKQRVAKSEILSAIRASSIGSLEEVEAVVLETDGQFSVIEKDGEDSNSALEGVKGFAGN